MADTLTFYDPDGVATVLTVLDGPLGRMLPPIDRTDDLVPGMAGSRRRQVRHGPREVAVPIWLEAATPTAMRTAMHDLAVRLDPVRGEGVLRSAGDATRDLGCSYVAGYEGTEKKPDGGATWQQAVIVFRAEDPYWYASAPIVEDWSLGEPSTFFPFFPLRLSSSEVFAGATIDNPGDVDAWPVWTVTGPGSDLVLRNLTTGKTLEASTVLADGETLTVDTRPRRTTIPVVDSAGGNRFPDLSSGSALWPLARGSNAVQVELGGTSGASSVRLSYTPGYLTP